MKRDLLVKSIGLGLSLATCVAAGFVVQGNTPKPGSPPAVDFNRDVRPILAKNCWTCHGPDPVPLKATGNMRLNTFAGATQDRGGYKAIVPGDPAKSVMLKRIGATDGTRMPPPASGLKQLTKEEQAILREWIKGGAEYSVHWAFVPPKPPALPKVSSPKWARNPIDLFILSKLDQAHLTPEVEADKATLLRRASLTLTGLPPTPAELDAFLKDARPDAYERQVDRLLANHRYGENQARYWLDAVRYADTHGLHIDNERAVYPYRDWVVRAFNEDLPYDQFLTWQLAGDLLKNPTLDQKIATGYVRMNPTTAEGGVIEAEFLAKNTMDRVDTTSTVFLGITLGCAKCHDHKYDPYTQKDYYSMYAFFDSTTDTPLDGNQKLHAPYIKAPTDAQEKLMKEMADSLNRLIEKAPAADAKKWALASAPMLPTVTDWQVAGPYKAADFDSAFATAFPPEPGAEGAPNWKPAAIKLDQAFAYPGDENASTYARTTLTAQKPRKLVAKMSSDDGIKVWLNGKLIHENKLLRSINQSFDAVTLDLKAGANELIVKVTNSAGGAAFYVSLADEKANRLSRASVLGHKDTLTEADGRELAELYYDLGPESADAKKYRKTTQEIKKLDEAIPVTYVAQEMEKPRETRLLKRGQYDLPGQVVYRMVPKVFGNMPSGAPKNRLGLAEWMTDPKNPLVARVFVNRVWQQHFGQGIVETAEDFGSRGSWPTNRQLLDYLAVRFIQDGWSLKQLQRMIVTSATFRQAATETAAKRAADPLNVLNSRGPRFRLDAEVVRDTALYVSGLLVEHQGGHGDKPYQPSGLWEAIAYPISDTARYMQDHGDALYRRSLYMFWKRTSPPPQMLLFHAPMRESCVVRRSRTNTPTQALATMNETGFFEAARAFAQRVIKAKKSTADRLDYAFRLAVDRAPTTEERTLMSGLLASELDVYKKDPESAKKALSVGESKRDETLDPAEHASWLIVCNMILNLDETLTQH